MRINIASFEIGNSLTFKVELYEVLGSFDISSYVVTNGPGVEEFPTRGQAEERFRQIVSQLIEDM